MRREENEMYRLRDERGAVVEEREQSSDAAALVWAAGRGCVQRWVPWPAHPSGEGGYWSIVFAEPAAGPAAGPDAANPRPGCGSGVRHWGE